MKRRKWEVESLEEEEGGRFEKEWIPRFEEGAMDLPLSASQTTMQNSSPPPCSISKSSIED